MSHECKDWHLGGKMRSVRTRIQTQVCRIPKLVFFTHVRDCCLPNNRPWPTKPHHPFLLSIIISPATESGVTRFGRLLRDHSAPAPSFHRWRIGGSVRVRDCPADLRKWEVSLEEVSSCLIWHFPHLTTSELRSKWESCKLRWWI